MIGFLFLFALNLFNLFEFKVPGGSRLGNVPQYQGFFGDFMSGVLATILSTPCSAPLLGTALGFAFTANAPTIFLVFLTIGLGLSTPFLLTAVFPASLKLLPRPGRWMDDLKKYLGLTLLLTIIWLYDIFLAVSNGNDSPMLLNLTLTTLFFAIYFHHRMGKNFAMKLLLYLAPVALFISLLTGETQDAEKLSWKAWSPQAMEELKGKTVFINFTADWCFTCKVNEKLVIRTKGFQRLIKKYDAKLLLADWTRYDPMIADFLKSHGYAGVPVYFVQKSDGTLVTLGEILTLKKLEKALQ